MTQPNPASLGQPEVSDAASTDFTTTKTRRSHRKSRHGCLECKRRHIRCDEHKPACVNCETAERVCSFLTSQATKGKQRQRQRSRTKSQASKAPVESESDDPGINDTNVVENAHVNQSTSKSSKLPRRPGLLGVTREPESGPYRSQLAGDLELTSTTFDANQHRIPSPDPPELSNVGIPPAGLCPGLTNIPNIVPKALFTSQRLVSLHHANKVPNLVAPNRDLVDIAVRHSVGSPYLIDEVLAFTAFHMAYLYPGSAVYLRHLAAELQNRSLVSFTRITELVPKDNKATAGPRFLFSALLGRHVLADTLNDCHADFHSFIERFVQCIDL